MVKGIFFVLIFNLIFSRNFVYSNETVYPIEKVEKECISKTDNTLEMNKCSLAAQEAWHNEIENSLIELKSILKPQDYKILLESQLAWEEFYKVNTRFTDLYPQYKSGTMFQNVKQGWRTGLVKQRALNLKEYINTFNF